jgi:hypothetical protein
MQSIVRLLAVSAAIFILLRGHFSHGQEKKDALSRLLKALEGQKEPKDPKRGSVFAFPQAVKILEADPKGKIPKEEIGFRSMHTYSTHWNEDKLIKEFGKPDEAGKENITVTGDAGVAETRNARMIRYGWLRIYLTPKGEIWYVGRKYKIR